MKLTARGRTVVARVSKVNDHDGDNRLGVPNDGTMKHELVLLSDGVIGLKTSFWSPEGKFKHSAGWKLRTKLKPENKAILKKGGPKADDLVKLWVSGYTAKGWEQQKVARG